jgi:hypothetical protein
MREHWAVKASRAKAQRTAARFGVLNAIVSVDRGVFLERARTDAELTITLTRIGKRTLDTDNLARSFKAVRDGIADAFYRDDGDTGLTWLYAQRHGEYAVEIKVEEQL